VSELLDKYVPSAGKADAGGGSTLSQFDRFLDRFIPGEPPVEAFKRELLHAAVGAGLFVAAALVLAVLPSRDWVLGFDAFAVGQTTLANLMGVADVLTLPFLLCGAALLALTGILARGEPSDLVDGLCIAIPVCGVAALGLAVGGVLILIAITLVNLLFWIVVGIVLAALFAIVAAVFLGALSA
jgi:hypothetical protein